MSTEQYDDLVLGSGAGGKILAWQMARAGRRTAVVERRWIGGSCPNINCLPSKNEVWSAKVADLVHHATAGGERTIAGSDVLVATGRTLNTAGIGLELAAVELDSRGYISVNGWLETTASDIWAIGECAGSPQFTHVSFDDCRIIRGQPGRRQSQHTRSPRPVLLVHGRAAGARRTERTRSAPTRQRDACRHPSDERGAPYPDHRRDRRLYEGARRDARRSHTGIHDDRPEAGEVMATVQMAMLGGLPYTVFRDAILTHPTMAEGLNHLFAAVPAPS
jgi:pyruvate/2-oxoglutarate dehydrogenase complex dihydrolipoamide dehydrogenase (E3) component